MSDEQPNRRLAAIMAADVVGYSRMMGADEAGTLLALKAHRETLFDPTVASHNGRVVKLVGDGAIVEFSSVVDAVNSALAIQRANGGRTPPDGRTIALRIGINLGDVIVDGDDIYGDGVNVAARLEALAEPGGICLSSIVNESVGNRVSAAFRDGGEVTVKNIDRPIRTWTWHPDDDAPGDTKAGDRPAASARPSPPDGGRNSIAVLPFDNMSGDPEQDYFSDGISEDIITDLSKVGGLVVIARNSSFVYKGTSVDIRKVGRELGVATVLEGSIRRAGNRVRVSAQLIDATSGAHLWAERYDRELIDIFAVQDDVTRQIVEALQVRLTTAEAESLHSYVPKNMDAHDLYLRARELILGASMDASVYLEATALLGRATTLDPDYGAAYATQALAEVLNSQNGWAGDPADAMQAAARNAEIAKAKSPNDPFSHYIASVAARYLRKPDVARENLETALKLGPNFSFALSGQGQSLVYEGNPKAAIPVIERAIRLDPEMKWQYLHFLGLAYLLAGMVETAAAVLRERVRLVPGTDRSRAYLASALGHMGEVDEARAVWAELQSINPAYSLDTHLDSLPFQHSGDAEIIRDGVGKAGLPG